MSQINNRPAPKRDAKKDKKMKNQITIIHRAGLLLAAGLSAVVLATTGCNTPVNVTGDYSTPQQTISGGINATTNGVTLSGAYSTTNQTVGGAVTVGK
jgi:hypothetical protein